MPMPMLTPTLQRTEGTPTLQRTEGTLQRTLQRTEGMLQRTEGMPAAKL